MKKVYKKRAFKARGGALPPILRSVPMKMAAKTGAKLVGGLAYKFAKNNPRTAGAITGSIIDLVVEGKDSSLYKGWNTISSIIGDNLSKKKKPVPGQKDKKLYPTTEGLNALITTYEGVRQNHDGIKTYVVNDKFYSGKKDSNLILAKKLYGETTINYYSTEKSVYNRLYALSGLNVKAIWRPYDSIPVAPTYANLDTLTTSTSMDGYYSLGHSLMDVACVLRNGLIGTVASPTVPTEMPVINAGDIDYLYPIQSYRQVIKMTNTNSFMPMYLKVYCLRAKRNTTFSPPEAYYIAGASSTSRLNPSYIIYSATDTILGCTGTPQVTSNIHLQATPSMSSTFQDIYSIVKVHEFKLGASDQVELTTTVEMSRSTSAADYVYDAINSNRVLEGSIQYMVEFQGVASPYYKSGATANTVSYSAMCTAAFAKLRMTVDKYATHSFPLSTGLGLYNPTSAQYTPSFTMTKQRPLVNYSDTAAYTDFSANPADLNKYLVPLVTSEQAAFAKPLINDPI